MSLGSMRVLHVSTLPQAPLDAAAIFYRDYLPRCQDAARDLAIVLPPSDHTHRAWRLAAVQELARVAAPLRVNAVSGEAEEAVAEALAYLAVAPGLTGQVLVLA